MTTLLKAAAFTLVFSASAFAHDHDTADTCLQGQDLTSESIDISRCPAVPSRPDSAEMVMSDGTKQTVGLGAWEMEVTKEGETYAIGSLNDPSESPRTFSASEGADEKNIECWAKGYYRLRALLQYPPKEYVKLKEAGYQGRFFQYQVDKRAGQTGFGRASLTAYQNHLVKWVTIVNEDGTCNIPTFTELKDFSKAQLAIRGIENAQ